MVIVCPKCQAVCGPKTSFCPACGAALGSPSSTGTAATRTSGETQPTGHTSSTAPAPAIPPKTSVSEPAIVVSGTALSPVHCDEFAGISGFGGGLALDPGQKPTEQKDKPASVIPSVSAILGMAEPEDLPISVAMNFHRVFVAGSPSTLEIQVKNTGATALEEVILSFESRGFKTPVMYRVPRLGPAQTRSTLLEVDPLEPGNFALNCSVKFNSAGQQIGLIGKRALRINAKPDNANISINLSDIQINSGSGANQALGADFGDVQIRDLIGKDVVRSLNDLINLELPKDFQPVELVWDSELSLSAIDSSRTQEQGLLNIPRQLIGCVQPGSRLKLISTVADGSLEVTVVTGPEFKLGRSQQESDLVAWFWPRNKENDERTRHLSKVHVICRCTASVAQMRDNGSANGASFDGQPLNGNRDEPLDHRGILRLGAEFLVDVMPFHQNYENEPPISNIRLWAGPARRASPLRGAIRFMVSENGMPQNVLWLGTDATFGSARTNPLVLDIPGVAEIQGKLLHYRECFWLENSSDSAPIQVNQLTLKPGEIAPLVSGQQVKLGQRLYRIEVS